MTIAGCDPSVTSTGLAIWREGRFSTERVASPKGSRDPGRMLWIAETVASHFGDGEDLLLAIEEHAGQQGYASANVALHWLIRAEVAKRANSRCIVVAPSTLKKFVTGKGNAEKGTVGAEIVKAWQQVLPEGPLQEDVLEAFALLQFGRAFCGHPGFSKARLELAANQKVVKAGAIPRVQLADTGTLLVSPLSATPGADSP
jgi:crossover junction endodeoxyribonuclease RuvC